MLSGDKKNIIFQLHTFLNISRTKLNPESMASGGKSILVQKLCREVVEVPKSPFNTWISLSRDT